jgi:hypothetical protein
MCKLAKFPRIMSEGRNIKQNHKPSIECHSFFFFNRVYPSRKKYALYSKGYKSIQVCYNRSNNEEIQALCRRIKTYYTKQKGVLVSSCPESNPMDGLLACPVFQRLILEVGPSLPSSHLVKRMCPEGKVRAFFERISASMFSPL